MPSPRKRSTRKIVVPRGVERFGTLIADLVVNSERIFLWLNVFAYPFAAFAINEVFEVGWGLSLLGALGLLVLAPLDHWGSGLGCLGLIAGLCGVVLLARKLLGG